VTVEVVRGAASQLTGPDTVTFDDVAEQMSTVVQRRIGFVPVPDDAALAQLVGSGVPEWFARGRTTWPPPVYPAAALGVGRTGR
jgi:uncharacterized protein YbjT (DUF2867 family)